MNTNEAFWENIELYRLSLLFFFEDTSKEDFVTEPKCNGKSILQRIEECIVNSISSIVSGTYPSLTLINRKKWSNVTFQMGRGLRLKPDASTTVVHFLREKSIKKYVCHNINGFFLSHFIYKHSPCIYCRRYMCYSKLTPTPQRDIYYQDPQLFGSQQVLDNLVDDIACMFQVPRRELHMLATSKGCVAGELQYQDSEGNYIICSENSSGALIPSDVFGIKNIRSSARFILVVEKDATFQKLLDDDLLGILKPCILITGKGFPDVNTREMTRLLWQKLKIPVLLLVDADPYGVEILCVYTYGSLALAYDSINLATPDIKWLGIHVTDIDRFNIPESALLDMTPADCAKIADLERRPYFQHNIKWAQQIQHFKIIKKKAEIQCLTSIGQKFLSEVYLPSKIKFGGWI